MQLENFFKKVNKGLLEICWSHWKRLGAYVEGPVNYCSTDPEALILLTTLIGKHDQRLLEIMAQWIHHYEHLIPIDRMKRVLDELSCAKFADPHFSLLNDVLQGALPESKKPRWKSIEVILARGDGKSAEEKAYKVETRKKLESHEKIIANNAQLTLRCLFGPSSRADILYCLVVLQKSRRTLFQAISAPHLARHLHYDRTAVHHILGDLEEGHIIRKTKKPIHRVILSYEFCDENKIHIESKIKEKTYIDWLQITFIVLELQKLESKTLKIKNEMIVKVKLQEVFDKINYWVAYSYIPQAEQKGFSESLEKVSVERLMEAILKQVDGIFQFITSK